MLALKALSVLVRVGFVLGAGAAVAESPATAPLSVENVAPGDTRLVLQKTNDLRRREKF